MYESIYIYMYDFRLNARVTDFEALAWMRYFFFDKARYHIWHYLMKLKLNGGIHRSPVTFAPHLVSKLLLYTYIASTLHQPGMQRKGRDT